jgi:hypothetical protein
MIGIALVAALGSAPEGLAAEASKAEKQAAIRKEAQDSFVNSGWDADAHAEAMAKAGQKGGAFEGAISASPGVWVYQLTEKGLALQATLQGTKYYKDDDLN